MALLVTAALNAQPASLVLDLETRLTQESGDPGPVMAVDDELYFVASDARHGAELWKLDGTTSGVTFLGDRQPGPVKFGASIVGEVSGTLLYWAAGLDGRRILWRVDPNEQGSQPVRSFEDPGGAVRFERGVKLHDRLYFVGDDGVHGAEVWESDGTQAGTRLLFDLCPGPCDGVAGRLTTLGDRLLFAGASLVAFPDLWVSDGTLSGTRKLHDDCVSCGSWFFNIVVTGEQAYFVGYDTTFGSEPWVTDGTVAGTHRVADLKPGAASSWPVRIDAALGSVYIVADGCGDRCAWRSDGTPGGTVLVPDLSPGFEYPTAIASLGPDLLFATRAGADERLYRLASGSNALVELARGFFEIHLERAIGSRFVFTAYGSDGTGNEPWVTDGTPDGTRRLGDLAEGNESSHAFSFVPFGGDVYFSAHGGERGRELWRTDGTPAGTELATEVGAPHSSSNPRVMAALGSRVFFAAREGGADGFWRYDGAQPRRLFEARAGEAIEHAAVLGDRVLFAVENPGAGGLEDFSAVLAGSLNEDEAGELARFDARPTALVTAGGHVFWGAQNDGQKIYASDGTPGGSGLLFDVNPAWSNRPFSYSVSSAEKLTPQPPDPPAFPRSWTPFAGKLYFVAFESLAATQLWTSDGTVGGTRVVRSFPVVAPGTSAANDELRELTVAAGRLFFTAPSEIFGRELWAIDSLGLNAQVVADLAPGSASSAPRLLRAVANGLTFFTEEAGGSVLWFSDGTTSGTRRLGALEHGGQPVKVGDRVVAAGDRLYFSAESPATGDELWVWDGGAPRLVRELQPGEVGAGIGELFAVDGDVLFAASDADHGVELWRTDGSADGTRRLGDLAPGLSSSLPERFFHWGEEILFSADDGVHGRELWKVAAVARDCRPAGDTLCLRDGRFEVKVSWRAPNGQGGAAQARPATTDTGHFWFSRPDNVELSVKVLDGTAVNGHYWVFAGALTDVEHDVTVRDVETGHVFTRHNPQGDLCGFGDTGALPSTRAAASAAPQQPLVASADAALEVSPFHGGRFTVEVIWQTPAGTGVGTAVPLSNESAAFWFFRPENLEMLVKILDAREVNGKFWVFWGALSDVGYRLRITDTATGAVREYSNPPGRLCGGADTAAF